MENKELVKNALKFVAIPAVNQVVGAFVRDNVPANNQVEKVLRGYGRMLFTGLALMPIGGMIDLMVDSFVKEFSNLTFEHTFEPNESKE